MGGNKRWRLGELLRFFSRYRPWQEAGGKGTRTIHVARTSVTSSRTDITGIIMRSTSTRIKNSNC
jgi:hypothetical protein